MEIFEALKKVLNFRFRLNEILDNQTRKSIIEMFPLDQFQKIPYIDIKEEVDSLTSRPDYHLSLLVEYGLLKRARGRGLYQLNQVAIQPLRDRFKKTVSVCLIGGCGDLYLFSDILDALEQISIIPKKYFLITSPEVNRDFKTFNKGKFSKLPTEVFEFDYQSVLRDNYCKVHDELEKLIKKKIYNYEIICEITGGTKPVSIALLNLSMEYGLRRCYFTGREIIWI